jgi:hypothetical protein
VENKQILEILSPSGDNEERYGKVEFYCAIIKSRRGRPHRKAGRVLDQRHSTPAFSLRSGLAGMTIITFSHEGETPYRPTPMQAKIEKRIREYRDKIIHEKLEPWWVVGTGKPLRVTMHSGRTISSLNCKFEGSLRDLFWHRDLIAAFLEDAIVTVLEEVAGTCREHGLPPEDYLTEAVGYLKGMVYTIYNRMAEIDARLRQEHDHRDVSPYVGNMEERIEEHRKAARLLAGQQAMIWGQHTQLANETSVASPEFPQPTDDYRNIPLCGRRMIFTPNQAKAMKVLWDAREKHEGALSESTILNRANLNADRLVDVFKMRKDGRTRKHEAWGTAVKRVSKGMYLLEP